MGMLPGVAKMKNQIANAGLDEKLLKRQMAIIDSMTPKERRNPDVLKASRKRRIAAGSGTRPEDINRLLKMHRGMADMMKAMGAAPSAGRWRALANMMGFGGGMPCPEEMQKLAQQVPGGLPPGMPGAPGAGMPGKMPWAAAEFPRNASEPWVENARTRRLSRTWEEEIANSEKPERKPNVPENPARARGHQEASRLSHRDRRQP